LIENNARVGAEVALAMAKLRQSTSAHASSSNYYPGTSLASKSFYPSQAGSTKTQTTELEFSPPMVQVFGSAAIDITTRPSIPLQPRTTTPGSILLTPGGVGRNIAEATQNLLPPGSVQLVSMIGTSTEGVDGFGKVLKLEMEGSGMRVDGLVEMKGRTAGCTLSLGMEGDLNDGVADMGIIEGLTPDLVRPSLAKVDKTDTTGGTSDSKW
jgi:pseudouridine-5'-phosphate glycosidase/pseudouridine kinase